MHPRQALAFILLVTGIILLAVVLVQHISTAGFIASNATARIPDMGFHLYQGSPPQLVGTIFIIDGICYFWNEKMGKPKTLAKAGVANFKDGTVMYFCGEYTIYTNYRGQENFFWGMRESRDGGTAEWFAVH